MRRLLIPVAALCVVMVVATSAWAQTPPDPSAPTPPTPPTPIPPPRPRPTVPQPPAVPDPLPTREETVHAVDRPRRDQVSTEEQNAPSAPVVDVIWWDIGYRYPGTYSTIRLLTLIEKIEATGTTATQ